MDKTPKTKRAQKPLTTAQRRVLSILASAGSNTYYTYLLARQYKVADVLVGLGLAERVSRHGGYRVTEAGRDWQLRGGGGTIAASKGAANVAAKQRQPVQNTDDPRGQFGAFLRGQLLAKGLSVAQLCERLGQLGLVKNEDSVGTWLNGKNGPRLSELDYLAHALGFTDWLAMLAEIPRPEKPKKTRRK